MRILLAIFAVLVALPVLLIVAIALGPVILGVLCAVGCAAAVFAIGNAAIGFGLLGRSARRTVTRR